MLYVRSVDENCKDMLPQCLPMTLIIPIWYDYDRVEIVSKDAIYALSLLLYKDCLCHLLFEIIELELPFYDGGHTIVW